MATGSNPTFSESNLQQLARTTLLRQFTCIITDAWGNPAWLVLGERRRLRLINLCIFSLVLANLFIGAGLFPPALSLRVEDCFSLNVHTKVLQHCDWWMPALEAGSRTPLPNWKAASDKEQMKSKKQYDIGNLKSHPAWVYSGLNSTWSQSSGHLRVELVFVGMPHKQDFKDTWTTSIKFLKSYRFKRFDCFPPIMSIISICESILN